MDEQDRYCLQQWLAAGAWILVGFILSVFIVAAVLWVKFAPPDDNTLAAMRKEGDEIVRQIEAHKSHHGSYPHDLASAQIVPPSHSSHKWVYERVHGSNGFFLCIGFDGMLRLHGWLTYSPVSGWKYSESAD
jgi:hypothetical protein